MSIVLTNFRCSWPNCSYPCNLKPSGKKTNVFSKSGIIPVPCYGLISRGKAGIIISASNPKGETENSDLDDAKLFQEEDMNYLWKLGAGSIAGAALVKYGSVAFPEITKPNLIEALVLISTPVVVAVLLLIKQSKGE